MVLPEGNRPEAEALEPDLRASVRVVLAAHVLDALGEVLEERA